MKPPAQPNEEGVPPGTYLETCNGCRLYPDEDGNRNMLECFQCPKPCGAVVRSNRVRVDECESFGNNAGTLVCDVPDNTENLPDGTYLGSCGGCRLMDNEDGSSVLTCSACKNTTGKTVESNFIIKEGSDACKTIGNNDGKLVCEDENEEQETESSSSASAETDGSEDEL